MEGQLFLVTLRSELIRPIALPDQHVVVNALSREDAKNKAFQFLNYNADTYIVSPLTDSEDLVFVSITL